MSACLCPLLKRDNYTPKIFKKNDELYSDKNKIVPAKGEAVTKSNVRIERIISSSSGDLKQFNYTNSMF
jgi:hypothetical protein